MDFSSCIQEGHFELSSGKHSPCYFQTASLFTDPIRCADIAEELLKKVMEHFPMSSIDTIVALANGATILGYEMARQHNKRFLFMETYRGEVKLQRGQRVSLGEKILIVENVIITGRTSENAVELLIHLGANPKGVASIIGCCVDISRLVPRISLHRVGLAAYDPPCPQCGEGVPLQTYRERKNGS